ncbi:MAG: transglutaminase-like domain-containing protein [Methylacidiphilales bacterium]|nr:transglutaminase-like domain-containing protein [Candidatus Methylacidiphilales bacterium]
MDEALKRSGENRPQLEQALKETPGQEMELLIRGARQYDLVNITAEHLKDDIAYARKAREEMPWGREIPDELWRNWVLPYRIADEDLDDWRPEFYEMLAPLVKEAKSSKEAVLLIHKWLWQDVPGGRVRFEVSENRDQTPRQLLQQIKIGRCFEINLLFTALLRSAGIPVRHTGPPWWTMWGSYHYWVEYWDTESKTWCSIEGANADPDGFMAVNQTLPRSGNTAFAAAYALAAYGNEADPIGREAWGGAVPADCAYQATGKLQLAFMNAGSGKAANYAVYVWSNSAWRPVALGSTDKMHEVNLAPTAGRYPYLVTASLGKATACALAEVKPGQDTSVTLMDSPAGPDLTVEFVSKKMLEEQQKKDAETKKQKEKDDKKKKKNPVTGAAAG